MGLWRNLFGPGENEVWGRVASQVGGVHSPSGWRRAGKIVLRKGSRVIVLDTCSASSGDSSDTYTRMRAAFRNPHPLEMDVYRENMFTKLDKMLGGSDMNIGDASFDQDFVIKGKPEATVRTFLGDARLRQLIAAQPRGAFRIRSDRGGSFSRKQYPDGIDELNFESLGLIKKEQLLKQLFELFEVAIERLAEVEPGCVFDVDVMPK